MFQNLPLVIVGQSLNVTLQILENTPLHAVREAGEGNCSADSRNVWRCFLKLQIKFVTLVGGDIKPDVFITGRLLLLEALTRTSWPANALFPVSTSGAVFRPALIPRNPPGDFPLPSRGRALAHIPDGDICLVVERGDRAKPQRNTSSGLGDPYPAISLMVLISIKAAYVSSKNPSGWSCLCSEI